MVELVIAKTFRHAHGTVTHDTARTRDQPLFLLYLKYCIYSPEVNLTELKFDITLNSAYTDPIREKFYKGSH